ARADLLGKSEPIATSFAKPTTLNLARTNPAPIEKIREFGFVLPKSQNPNTNLRFRILILLCGVSRMPNLRREKTRARVTIHCVELLQTSSETLSIPPLRSSTLTHA